jgi:uncharacterized delta-60 repeat protein
VFDSVIQSDGKIITGGLYTQYNGVSENYVIRLDSNGFKDTSFNLGSGLNNLVRTVYYQPDTKIVIGGDFTTFTGTSQNRLIRLNSDGSKDTSFDIGTGFSGNPLNSIYVSNIAQYGVSLYVGGSFTTFTGTSQNGLIKLNSDGSKDTSFNIGSGFNNVVSEIYIQSDDKILVGGSFTTFTGTTQGGLIRLNTDGSIDNTFSVGTGFNNSVLDIILI